MGDYKASLTNHNAALYAQNTSFVYSKAYTSAVLDLLNPQPGERICDLGCGTGEVTIQIKDAVGDKGVVYGLDSSEDMLVKAGKNAGDKITFAKADIQRLPETLDPSLKGTFDAVFSSAVLHWCKADPAGVVEGIKWLLKPGGRVAFEFGGFGNGVGVRQAIHKVLIDRGEDPVKLDPWWFPTDKQYSKLLESKGLVPKTIGLFPRPTPLPGDLIGWLKTFVRNTFFVNFNEAEQQELMNEVQDLYYPDGYWNNALPGTGVKPSTPAEKGEDGWEIMYVRLRGLATKPE